MASKRWTTGISLAALVVSLGSAGVAAYSNVQARQWAEWTTCVRRDADTCPAGWAIAGDVERISGSDSRFGDEVPVALDSEAARRDRHQVESILSAIGGRLDPGCALSPRAERALDAVVGHPRFLEAQVVQLHPGHRATSGGTGEWSTTVLLKVEVGQEAAPSRPGDPRVFYTARLSVTGAPVSAEGGCPATWRVSDIAEIPGERIAR